MAAETAMIYLVNHFLLRKYKARKLIDIVTSSTGGGISFFLKIPAMECSRNVLVFFVKSIIGPLVAILTAGTTSSSQTHSIESVW